MNKLTDKQYWQLQECAEYVDEVFVELRKGKAQTRYIIKVSPDAQYFDLDTNDIETVDQSLVGYWMQRFATDNSWDSYKRRLEDKDDFVKCEKNIIQTINWREIDE